ncbi:NAD-dependent epimerase/dehydratase family protein [Bauldia sp.]|uniref:NAD-dependent epimerase/dehydratase family protein n=1 Tax=Bauldia sp. TaxID=2575872 RepID=UPI003BAA419F
MAIVVFGAEGNVGRRLKAALPDVVGIDAAPGADIVADLATVDYDSGPVHDALRNASSVIHIATEPNPGAADDVHWQSVVNTARLVRACAQLGVPRLVLPSSDWAEPKAAMPKINAYGWSKRAMEAFAEMYNQEPGRVAVALRIGWVPRRPDELEGASDWLMANYWDDEQVVREFRTALGLDG